MSLSNQCASDESEISSNALLTFNLNLCIPNGKLMTLILSLSLSVSLSLSLFHTHTINKYFTCNIFKYVCDLAYS